LNPFPYNDITPPPTSFPNGFIALDVFLKLSPRKYKYIHTVLSLWMFYIQNIDLSKNVNGTYAADTIDSIFLVTLGIESPTSNNYLVDFLGVRILEE
jgi:hypothetical protein